MADIKMSNPSVYSMPAGDVAVLVGAEVRAESMEDLRDPELMERLFTQLLQKLLINQLSLIFQMLLIVVHLQIPLEIEWLLHFAEAKFLT